MNKKTAMQRATIGPLGEVPFYGRQAWTRWPASVRMEDVWQLCAPTVMKHMQTLPLWKVFCVVYYEGLVHGAQGQQDLQEAPKSRDWSDCG